MCSVLVLSQPITAHVCRARLPGCCYQATRTNATTQGKCQESEDLLSSEFRSLTHDTQLVCGMHMNPLSKVVRLGSLGYCV